MIVASTRCVSGTGTTTRSSATATPHVSASSHRNATSLISTRGYAASPRATIRACTRRSTRPIGADAILGPWAHALREVRVERGGCAACYVPHERFRTR